MTANQSTRLHGSQRCLSSTYSYSTSCQDDTLFCLPQIASVISRLLECSAAGETFSILLDRNARLSQQQLLCFL